MKSYQSISELTVQLNVTSRTLRHWEEKGLFRSARDPQSGWRVYDENTAKTIHLITFLRELDLSIKDIKTMLEDQNRAVIVNIMENQINRLNVESHHIAELRNRIHQCLKEINDVKASLNWFEEAKENMMSKPYDKLVIQNQWEEIIMTNDTILSGALRIITLPKMRVAVCNVISESPEDEALEKVVSWAESEQIMGTAKIYGFNTTAFKPGCNEYGWAASVTIPEEIILPDYLEEKRFTGGLYASFNSTNEVYDSWQTLMRLLKANERYDSDGKRTCLEEHIPSGEDDFYLNLLEPIKLK